MTTQAASFIKLVQSRFKFGLYLFYKLPAAFLAGVRVREMSEDRAVVSIPFKWLTQNPFRSTYFASLSMAAEMSTGVLALTQVHQRQPAVSMLVVNLEAAFFKKATGRSSFVCEDGALFQQAVEETIKTGESRTVRARSTGKNEAGETVAEFYITWSFKVRGTK